VTGEEELLSVSHTTGVTPRSQKNVTMFKAESYVGHKVARSNDIVINTMWAWMSALGGETCQFFGGNVAFPQPQGGETGLRWRIPCEHTADRRVGRCNWPSALTVNRSIGPRYQMPWAHSENLNMSEAAEPAAPRVRTTAFVIVLIVLTAGVQVVWMAFLVWLAIRAIF
jgi:hypothetical protein